MEKLKNFIFRKIGLISILLISIVLILTTDKTNLTVGMILELIILTSFLFKLKLEYENHNNTRKLWKYIIILFVTVIFIIIKLN